MTLSLGIPLLLLCVAVEAFFAGAEVAVMRADRTRLRERAEDGDATAQIALELLADQASLLGTCLTGTGLALVSGSAVAAALVRSLGFPDGFAVLALAPVLLVLGEALPKTVLQHHADAAVDLVARPLRWFRATFRPFLAVVQAWSKAVSWLTGGQLPEGYLTRKELLQLLESTRESPIDPEDRRLIRGVLSLQELSAADAMTPLVQVVAVARDATVGVAADIAVRTQHSRLPVYSGRIDHILGVVHQADLLFLPDDATPLSDHVRPVRFVPDVKPADVLFAEMRASGEHFAVVVDEYGGCVGIVTLEDLLEQLVGDIEDERDVMRPALLELEDGSWSVPGHAEVEEVALRVGLDLPEGDYETVAGLVLARLGHIPEPGEVVDLEMVRLRVEEATDRAIQRVRLIPERAVAEA